MKESDHRKDAKTIDFVQRPTHSIFSDESPPPVNKSNQIIFIYNVTFCEFYTM